MNSQPILPTSDISIQNWPRRATKACASCRRDKIRCDGTRPCTGCLKKGYSAEQCIDGCDPCRRARVRCEARKPCQRCNDLGLDCIEQPVHMLARQDPIPDVSPVAALPAKAHGSERAKLACKSCRRDNKKCDDQRPCSRCVSRSEECVHVGRNPKSIKLRCQGCREDGKRCEEARPCRFCAELGRECITLPRKGRGHGMRVKAACIMCRKVSELTGWGFIDNVLNSLLYRRDKIRCDGARPCSPCQRKGYQCIDRACKSCTDAGKASECVHRNDIFIMQQMPQSPGPSRVEQPSMSLEVAGASQSMDPMTDLVQQLYIMGPHHAPMLAQHHPIHKRDFIPALHQ